jgi:hypothetical protein
MYMIVFFIEKKLIVFGKYVRELILASNLQQYVHIRPLRLTMRTWCNNYLADMVA